MSVKTKALLAIFTASLLWASAGATAKILFKEAPPFVVAFHRFALASILVMPLFLRAKKPKGYIRALLPPGIFNALNILFYYSGLSLTTANTSTILGTAVPLTTVILSRLFIGERVSMQKLIGISIGLIGTFFAVILPILEKGAAFSGNIYGNLLLVASLISWSFYIVNSRSVLSDKEFSPVISTSMNLFTVTVFTFGATLVTGQPVINSALTKPSYLSVLLYAAIGITIVTFFLFQWAVQHVSASTASLKEYMQLIFAIGINAVILGEHFTLAYFIGSFLIVIGVLVATGDHVSRKLASILFSQGD